MSVVRVLHYDATLAAVWIALLVMKLFWFIDKFSLTKQRRAAQIALAVPLSHFLTQSHQREQPNQNREKKRKSHK